jgi:hypothetical protein
MEHEVLPREDHGGRPGWIRPSMKLPSDQEMEHEVGALAAQVCAYGRSAVSAGPLFGEDRGSVA